MSKRLWSRVWGLNMDSKVLATLQRRSVETHSDAVIVLKGSKIVYRYASGEEERLIHLMSCTKSIVSLAFGELLASGCLGSLDEPVSMLYPEWRQGRKRDITIRMLLNHTSGLQDVGNAGAEIEPAPDAIQLALAAELDHEPGTTFTYNNKAVNLLAGVVHRLTGHDLDAFVSNVLFRPLGISGYEWIRDQSGTPYVMAGLCLTPSALAKIGRLVVDGGLWNGTRVVRSEWIRELFEQGHSSFRPHGLLWWRWFDHDANRLRGYFAQGWLGQRFVLLPDHKVVGVRLVKRHDGYNHETDEFADFMDLVWEYAVTRSEERG